MYKTDSVRENETYKILCDFEIQTDGCQKSRPRVNKKNWKKKNPTICFLVDFAVPANHREKIKENEKRVKYVDLLESFKTVEHQGDGETNCSWCTWNGLQVLRKKSGGIGDQKKNRDQPDQSTVRSARILWRVQETWRNLLSLCFLWKKPY